MKRQLISSGAKWESIVGYSRAVKIGNHLWVAGTTATDENGEVVGKGDVGAQTRYILAKIERALKEGGASMSDVVRTRIFAIDITQWEAIGRAHGEVFANIRPASTMVEISKLIDPDHLVEIEVDAYINHD
ncbi:MAG: RidA family protein [Betaproteobacteria bacterium]|nr:RidA family protein [Betaproteobacteria bacterium]